MSRKIFSLSIILLAIWITLFGCSKREHTNPLDPNNPNSNAVLLPPPSGLTATPDYGSITLTWNAVPEAKNYQVYRGDKKIVTINTIFYKDTGLTLGKRYSYQVASVHPCGLGGHKSKPVYAVPKKGAKIVYSKYEVDSDDNGDGIVNRGETIGLDLYLKNTGTSTAKRVNATLSENDAYVSITDDKWCDYGLGVDLTAGGEAYGYFVFTVADNCPYNHVITFSLSIRDKDGNSWSDGFTITVK